MNLYTYVTNNPLKWIDPTGHWCTSADGKYAHSGACDDPANNSRYEDDILHDGASEIWNGKNVDTYYYPYQDRLARWAAGDSLAYNTASQSQQRQMYHDIYQSTMSSGASEFGSGFMLGLEMLVNPGSKITKTISFANKLKKASKAAFDMFENFEEHYMKHVKKQKEFGNISEQEYLEGAFNLARTASDGKNIFFKVLENGRAATFNKRTNELVITHGGGDYIGTYMKPDYGMSGVLFFLNLK
ncbi:hypothetical protein WMW72_18560 [Paenibacillus filicis]|uniref:RHS repeat-associated core domain-containing protein n=1 Tax=Paenibacillus filicis TaxID=669464 RepID=A0ABU9DM23_9BACL